ncbi:hypothetical protein EDD17DRAFT_1894993 [Pisolithus thermaeus]|nr:hypothetical protein EDD17DRAFT_1894993 [Pisolithus thermaeus]
MDLAKSPFGTLVMLYPSHSIYTCPQSLDALVTVPFIASSLLGRVTSLHFGGDGDDDALIEVGHELRQAQITHSLQPWVFHYRRLLGGSHIPYAFSKQQASPQLNEKKKKRTKFRAHLTFLPEVSAEYLADLDFYMIRRRGGWASKVASSFSAGVDGAGYRVRGSDSSGAIWRGYFFGVKWRGARQAEYGKYVMDDAVLHATSGYHIFFRSYRIGKMASGGIVAYGPFSCDIRDQAISKCTSLEVSFPVRSQDRSGPYQSPPSCRPPLQISQDAIRLYFPRWRVNITPKLTRRDLENVKQRADRGR